MHIIRNFGGIELKIELTPEEIETICNNASTVNNDILDLEDIKSFENAMKFNKINPNEEVSVSISPLLTRITLVHNTFRVYDVSDNLYSEHEFRTDEEAKDAFRSAAHDLDKLNNLIRNGFCL